MWLTANEKFLLLSSEIVTSPCHALIVFSQSVPLSLPFHWPADKDNWRLHDWTHTLKQTPETHDWDRQGHCQKPKLWDALPGKDCLQLTCWALSSWCGAGWYKCFRIISILIYYEQTVLFICSIVSWHVAHSLTRWSISEFIVGQ